MKEVKKGKKTKKRGVDINDKSKWGHRFEIRNRTQVVRDFFSEKPLPKKRSKSEDADKDKDKQKPPKIKKAQAEPKPSKRRKVRDVEPEVIVSEILEEILENILGDGLETKLEENEYINCDLRYFNLDYIVERHGFFDVIAIDPPWRIKGGQKNSDSPFMFSNNKFQLEYDTLSNQEIMDIPIEKLSRKGFCFLWVLSGNMQAGYECLNKWGYECVDHLIWVKTSKGGSRAMISHGFYFLHSTETCLVGYKCHPDEKLEIISKISNDLIISDVRKKSQKPDQLYEIIDMMMPNSRKIEVFARNNNLRKGWFSLGNQIGEVFEKWKNHMMCDKCKNEIPEGKVRYKSRKMRNFDICDKCIDNVFADRGDTQLDYFRLENKSQQNVLHHYHKCDRCGVEPIWATRFQCLQCENIDYCENCYDEIIESKTGCYSHIFQAVEIPQAGNGLPVHENKRCVLCYQKPILGPCFLCANCNHFVLCNFYIGQTCFFSGNSKGIEKIKGHEPKHKIEMITLANVGLKVSTCFNCGASPLIARKHKCNHCFSYELCEGCFNKRDSPDFKASDTHLKAHTFSFIV